MPDYIASVRHQQFRRQVVLYKIPREFLLLCVVSEVSFDRPRGNFARLKDSVRFKEPRVP